MTSNIMFCIHRMTSTIIQQHAYPQLAGAITACWTFLLAGLAHFSYLLIFYLFITVFIPSHRLEAIYLGEGLSLLSGLPNLD